MDRWFDFGPITSLHLESEKRKLRGRHQQISSHGQGEAERAPTLKESRRLTLAHMCVCVLMMQPSSPSVKAIFVVDSEGNRVCAKYYDKSYPTLKDQLELEKKLYLKTKNSNARLEGMWEMFVCWCEACADV